MCNCKEFKGFGLYENTVNLKAPPWSSKELISVDSCIKDEIKNLWLKGVRTCGSCCGHNVSASFINVKQESINKMEDLGYKHIKWGDDEQNYWTFTPKSVKDPKFTETWKKLMLKIDKNYVFGNRVEKHMATLKERTPDDER